MNRQEFEKAMGPIFENFGNGEYTPMRVKIIWDNCGDLPRRNFEWIVAHFLRSRSLKYPPLPDHFIEAAIEQRKVLSERRFNQPEPTKGLQPTGQWLEKEFNKFGVTNLSDLLKKFPKTKTEDT